MTDEDGHGLSREYYAILLRDVHVAFLCVCVCVCVCVFKRERHVLMTNEMHSSYNQFFPQFFSVLHVSNESSRSSSGTRHNILFYTVFWYNRYNRAVTL